MLLKQTGKGSFKNLENNHIITHQKKTPSSSSSSPPKTLIKIKQKCNFQIQPTRKYSNLDKSGVYNQICQHIFFPLLNHFHHFQSVTLQLWYYLYEFSVLNLCIVKPCSLFNGSVVGYLCISTLGRQILYLTSLIISFNHIIIIIHSSLSGGVVF